MDNLFIRKLMRRAGSTALNDGFDNDVAVSSSAHANGARSFMPCICPKYPVFRKFFISLPRLLEIFILKFPYGCASSF